MGLNQNSYKQFPVMSIKVATNFHYKNNAALNIAA